MEKIFAFKWFPSMKERSKIDAWLEENHLRFEINGYRRLMSTKSRKPGETVFLDKAIATATEERCMSCFGDMKFQCPACKTKFCSKDCAETDKPLHRVICKKENRIHAAPIWLVLKTLKWLESTNDFQTELFPTLVSCESDWPEEKLRMIQEIEDKIPKKENSLFTTKKLLSIFNRNAYVIYDREFVPMGEGIFPSASLINHSCSPNVFVQFTGTTMHVVAIAHIAEGDEILSSYVDPIAPVLLRREMLQERYAFTCECSRCLQELKLLSVVPKLTIPQWTYKVFTGFRSFMDSPDFFAEQKKWRIDSPVKYFHVIAEKYDKALDAEEWNNAASFCKAMVAIYMGHFPPFHPITGQQLFILAKMLWNANEDPTEYLMLAKKILSQTHSMFPNYLKDVHFLEELIRERYSQGQHRI
jgi:hypothetical protein